MTACTSSGRLHVVTAPATELNSYKTALIHVSSEMNDATKEAIQLEATIAMMGRKKLPFQQVFTRRNSGESFGDLRIDARIVRLERVTSESRVALGMLAGRARLTADVTLIEGATNAVLARFTVEGQSSIGATTEQAIRRASEQIIAFVEAHLTADPKAGAGQPRDHTTHVSDKPGEYLSRSAG